MGVWGIDADECDSDEFTCGDGECIYDYEVCDGFSDWADGKDEDQGCGNIGIYSLMLQMYVLYYHFSSSQLMKLH